MTVHSLLLFLQRIKDGQVKAQGGRAWITRIKRMFYDVTTFVFLFEIIRNRKRK